MNRITTSSGKTFDVQFAWAPDPMGKCMIQMPDERRLPEIAADFDGVERVHYVDESAEREYDWDGYTALDAIMRQPGGAVQILLAKEG